MEKNVKNEIMNILENKLPMNIANLISTVNNENNQLEYEQIGHIYREIEFKLTEMLIDECRIPQNLAESFTNKLFDIDKNGNLEQIRKIILQSREQKKDVDVQTTTAIIRNNANKLDFDETSQIAEEFTSFSNTSSQIEEILSDNVNNSNVLYQINDIIQTEMLYQCQRWVSMAEFKNDLDIISTCKSALVKLNEKIEDNYLQNGKNILDTCNEKIEEEVTNSIYSCLDVLNKTIDENNKENIENNQEEKETSNTKEFYDENGYKVVIENNKATRYNGDFIVDVRDVEDLKINNDKENIIDSICEKADKTQELETLYNELKTREDVKKEEKDVASDFI